MTPGQHKRLQRRSRCGMTLVEALVASFLLAVGLMGMVRLWTFSYLVTERTDNQAVAYNLGRRAIETVRNYGFYKNPEATIVRYYDDTQTEVAQANGLYSVTTSTTSSLPWPNNWARRMVSVTVKSVRTGATLYSTNTILVRFGL